MIFVFSIPEKKEQIQNGLSLKSNLRKKIIKVGGETKISRAPSKTPVTKLIQPAVITRVISEPPVTIPEAPIEKQEDDKQRLSQVYFLQL